MKKIEVGSRVRILQLSTAGYENPINYVGREGTVESLHCGVIWVHVDGNSYRHLDDGFYQWTEYGYQFEPEDLEVL